MIHEAREEKQAQTGDADEFASLYRRHGRDVLGMLLHLTHGDRAEAEDLTQETFLAAFRGRRSFAGRASVRAWLVGIAVRRFRDARRRPPAPAEPSRRPRRPIPASLARERRRGERLPRPCAFARLPENQQTALLLVLGQGLTYREAADALGEPIGTIKWRVSEATGKLRAYLTEDEEDASAQTITCPCWRPADCPVSQSGARNVTSSPARIARRNSPSFRRSPASFGLSRFPNPALTSTNASLRFVQRRSNKRPRRNPKNAPCVACSSPCPSSWPFWRWAQ